MSDAQGAEELPPLLSEEVHERGWLDFDLVYRSGKKETVRLTAPDFMRAREIALSFAADPGEETMVRACLGDNAPVNLSRLAPDSAAELFNVCFALTFGEERLKKIRAAAIKLAGSLPRGLDSAANSSASPGVASAMTPPATGASPN